MGGHGVVEPNLPAVRLRRKESRKSTIPPQAVGHPALPEMTGRDAYPTTLELENSVRSHPIGARPNATNDFPL
jgi:hypothetical protein